MKYLEESTSVYEKADGVEHVDARNARHAWANAASKVAQKLVDEGNFEASLASMKLAHTLHDRTYGPYHDNTRIALIKFAVVKYLAGHKESGIRMLRHVRPYYTSKEGIVAENTPQAVAVAEMAGALGRSLQMHDEAIALLREWCRMEEQTEVDTALYQVVLGIALLDHVRQSLLESR